MNPAAYPHPVTRVRRLETHISWIFLTGRFAYKVKKPVRLDFLDFSTLSARLHYCEEELRLNRRTAPELYLDVVPITGSPDLPSVEGNGQALEYAVKMREFPDADRLDHALADERLDVAGMAAFGAGLAEFHAGVAVGESAAYGGAERTRKRVCTNLEQTGRVLRASEARLLEPLARWLEQSVGDLSDLLDERAAAGMTRECHGDLHLGNLVVLRDRIAPFDCIEFDPALRWIDVIDDVAFLVMDLLTRHRADLAYAFLNGYLAATGDYRGAALLDLYTVHRAIVRAKVHAIARHDRVGAPPERAATSEPETAIIRDHLLGAKRWISRRRPNLILMHGLPASGKSHVAERLATELPAIRVSSDLERKRLAGLGRHDSSGSAPGGGLYDQAHNRATYDHLRTVAAWLLRAKHNVIVDASFLHGADRAAFYTLAGDAHVTAVLVDCRAPLELLEHRIAERSRRPADSEAGHDVLRYALANRDPLQPGEPVHVLQVDTTVPLDAGAISTRIVAVTASEPHSVDAES